MTRPSRFVALAAIALLGLAACGGTRTPRPVAAAPPPPSTTAPSAGAGLPAPPSEDDAPVPITHTNPTWGSRNALVTLVEFSDFQCPFCAKVAPTLEKLRETYGPDDLRIVYKHFPLEFHAHARPAAEAAQGIFGLGGGEAFWRFFRKAYASTELPESFDAWAESAGVDVATFRSGMAAHRWAAAVDDDILAAKKLGVNGTPAFFINGVMLSGAQPFAKFQTLIDEAIIQAKDAIDHGVPRDHLYVVATTYNRKNGPSADDADEGAEDDTKAWKMPVGTSPVRGPKTALVTLVEFADFECPYCARVEPTLRNLAAAYGDRLRIVWKNNALPFHPRAEPAAELAYEARAEKGDASFWDAHDRLLDDPSHLEDEDLLSRARAMKLDVARVKSAVLAAKYKATLEADADLADELDANGTPFFFINGRRLVGAQPIERFRAVIDEEEAKARALLAKGVQAASIYDELQKQAAGPPPPEKKAVPVTAGAPSRGGPGAPVVIQEFADFQCPFCKRAEETVDKVLAAYPGRVRVLWRNMPLSFHADAALAAEAAMEAYAQKGSPGFWKMHDLLFANQAVADGLKRPALERYATQMGLDAAKFGRALDASVHQGEIDADTKAAETAQISGTPAFVINGFFLSGAQPYPRFRRLVERALAAGRAH
jgi:protein-disulfide isomerase